MQTFTFWPCSAITARSDFVYMMAKLFIILGLVAVALIFCLQVAGVINGDVASDVIGRTLGIIAILGIAVGGIGMVVGGRKKNDSGPPPPNSGPKF